MRGPASWAASLALAAALTAVPLYVGAAPPSEAEMAARIDARLAEVWAREGVEPAPPASDAEFLRRAWLDLCGIIPPLNDAGRHQRHAQLPRLEPIPTSAPA